jgi:four helix bundle protein
MRSRFRSLVAYRLSSELADHLHLAVRRWPAYDRSVMGLQLVRAADSVHANIAEAAGRWTPKERRRYLLIARGSLYETENWIARARARNLLNNDYDSELTEIAKTLSGLIKRTTT